MRLRPALLFVSPIHNVSPIHITAIAIRTRIIRAGGEVRGGSITVTSRETIAIRR